MNNELDQLIFLVYNGYSVYWPKKRLTLSRINRTAVQKVQYQVHKEDGESNLYDNIDEAADRFLLLKNRV